MHEALERLGAHRLLPDVIAAWQRQVASLVPDPGRATGSKYEPCAEWLALARELDPSAAARLLGTWRREHKLKRNLWKALRSRGLLAGGD